MSYDIGSTHIPILIAIARIMRVRTVLELGTGWYSTPTFLNREVFPDLEIMISVEDNPKWYEAAQVHNLDPRFKLSSVLPISFKDKWDLIFVDNSDSHIVRAQTIRRVAEESSRSLVVVHDAEDPTYIPEIQRFQQYVTVRAYSKWTAVAGNNITLPQSDLSYVDVIEKNQHLEPTDVKGWQEIFR